ncbi:Nucleotidyltransferase [Sodiomyces alkalinus F11]|uniref:DNA polymerase n=1 Tax=Sodiomyces alkalinus (strain CBS 110278 / VKM F-3762 / F11) TaxID=1314773 RepID=A0A3N2Q054_SODAK|nr:Nucleotidyltransferase [Sodiomyces alkalinus F11]ROT40133.1 Nucleotidyltransferase [Sodiomyces alkalinus F11]
MTSLAFPPIFLLPVHLSPEQLQQLVETIPTLTSNINEASLVLGNVTQRKRALFELRKRHVLTEPLESALHVSVSRRPEDADSHATSSDTVITMNGDNQSAHREDKVIKVVKLSWFTDSLRQHELLPLEDYIVYAGRRMRTYSHVRNSDRVVAEASETQGTGGAGRRPFREKLHRHFQPPSLFLRTTSEHDDNNNQSDMPMFPMTPFSCQRRAPNNPPNKAFIDQLKQIREKRLLLGDQIGVRAYSTSIATLAAYPYAVADPAELEKLPGCGTKIAELYNEWKWTGKLSEVEEAQSDPKLCVIRLFYMIWGVGDATAREFYNKGWRDLDDIVQYGWNSLTRVQQIGVKYYDEFQQTIPREEVEAIFDTVLHHARNIHPDCRVIIVGGYRRGKERNGDVDLVVSHPDESATYNLVSRLVDSLEQSGDVTHILTLSLRNSERGQTPVSWRGNSTKGTGFDTLDKALVPQASRMNIASPGPHRRVDIIVSPWKTVGCAILGWSGETTFQRDLRIYCKKKMLLKFDSSGVRSRINGSWVDLEGGKTGVAPDFVTAEKRVFKELGLEWIAPENRCTG